jgi:AAA domain, putative AbiEii toxin, Type IV TA system
MFFMRLSPGVAPPAIATNRAFLVYDKWNDWGKFCTQFALVVFDDVGVRTRIGEVKIGERGLRPSGTAAPGERAPEVPKSFDFLEDQFFSLGQNEAYYEALAELPEQLRVAVLTGLRDCAFNLEIFVQNLHEDVMRESLLREVREQSVRGRLGRLANGDARLTRFDFSFELPEEEGAPPVSLDFQVVPESMPPTNVHVVIGRNGVGKTHCMRQLTHALLERPAPEDARKGQIVKRSVGLDVDWDFAGLVLVSFSAFDSFDLAPEKDDALPCQQVGLREHVDGTVRVKTAERLALDFAESLGKCREGLRASRWREAIEILEADDLFAEAEVQNLLEIRNSEEEWKVAAARRFERLSSGHAIVLLTVTKLVELVDEKTLVLLDEPEGHLHPPLIAAFVRCLSTLLVRRNGVAIIATHSPVVLQEVPASSVWKLRRSSAELIAERPEVETFGENIGILTREVFAYQVTRAGFHKMLSTAVDAGEDFDEIVESFSGQLGGEARAIVRGLIAQRDREVTL